MRLTVFPKRRITRPALLAAAGGAALLLGLFPRGAAAADSPAVASHAVASSTAQVKRIKYFWTPQRMRNATPLRETPSRREVAQAAGQTALAPASAGATETVPPTPGRASSVSSDGKVPKASLIGNPTTYPYSTQGKVFFQALDHGAWQTFVCSATVVNTPTKRVIFSAGHCAHDAGSWSRRFTFVPGYHNKFGPYGSFVASRLYTTPQWFKSENFSYDISAAVLGGTRKVAAVVGSRGIKFNAPRQQNFVSFGYPAAPPFSGESLYDCPSPYRGQDFTTATPRTQWIACNMTGGSSGGGWIVQGQYLNSVNSYGYDDLPNRMYGPYFGAAAQQLYNTVKYAAP